MAQVTMTTELPVPADSVWQTIGSFGGLPDWHPAIESCEVKQEGGNTLRTLHLVGGGTIVEKLESSDDKERSYSYSIMSGPLPVADYTGTIRLREAGDGKGCTIEWSSDFKASGAPENEAVAAIRGIYEAGFENLKRMFGA
ncbi:MAG TPA: SRPBCC family protein [Kiloniellales bacterium]|nr:SRPBCC family protein [Kiloniellales bacterium]